MACNIRCVLDTCCRALMLVALICALPGTATAAGEPGPPEAMSASVLNLVKFVEWSSAPGLVPGAPIVIGVVGPDPFRGTLEEAVADKVVDGHALLVRHFSDAFNPDRCHVLVIGDLGRSDIVLILKSIAGEPVLTVGDRADFADLGGAVALSVESGHVRIRVNRKTLTASRLKLSAQILRLATEPSRPEQG